MAYLLPATIVQKIWDMAFGQDAAPEVDPVIEQTKGVYEDGVFYPSPIDVYITQMLLVRGLGLPLFIADSILDLGEYWARSVNELDFMLEHGASLQITSGRPNTFLVGTYFFVCLVAPNSFLIDPFHTCGVDHDQRKNYNVPRTSL